MELADTLAGSYRAHLEESTLSISSGEAEATIKRERVVVIVGAGASLNAAALPLGAGAANILRKELSRVDVNLLTQEIERLRLEHRLVPEEMETQLLALSRFDRPGLLEKLDVIFSRRHYPSVAYEVLAHLLKHRFVDAIFNFNFDEILDQAIADELGSDSYYRVLSEGDCREPLRDLDRPNGRPRLPLYIKPHGTISAKSSMRFTRGDYFLLPNELRELTSKLFADHIPIKLLVVGHAMNSFEFNDILRQSRPEGSRLFVMASELSQGHQQLSPSNSANAPQLLEVHPSHPLDAVFLDLWEQVSHRLTEPQIPRGILRHRLVAALFHHTVDLTTPIKPNSTSEELEYLHDRTLIEICLAVAKAKGFFHVRQLMKSRAGQYFLLHRQLSPTGRSLAELCWDLGLAGASGDALTLDPELSNSGDIRTLIVPRDNFVTSHIGRLYEKTLPLMSVRRRTPLEKNKKLFEQTLTVMYDGDEVEVTGEVPFLEHEFFASPIPLPTLAATRVATRKLLAMDWDVMLVVAETGKWLVEESSRTAARKRERTVRLLVADASVEDALEDDSKNSHRRLDVRWLPWWLHNQHMTVCLRSGQPLGAIFFERRLRSSTIAPVYLKASDAGIAVNKFVSYWLRAQGLAQDGKDPFIDHESIERNRRQVTSV